MEEDPTHAQQSGSSVSGSTHTIPQQTETQELLIPSFTPSSAPSSPTPTGTLSRLGFKSLTSPSATAPGSPVDRGQVSAITVVALLDKLVNMMEAVQENQQRMEQRQADLEGAVRTVQGDVTRLSKTHISTSNSVSKLLERSRKVSGHLKEVRERMDKQAVQVKKLEANHSHLLKRNHFKVLIFQEDNEIPATVSQRIPQDPMIKECPKTPQPSQYDAESTRPNPSYAGSIDGSQAQEESLQTINLSSDEEDFPPTNREGEEMCEFEDGSLGLGTSRPYERRSDKIKRSSLKKVETIKRALTRQSIEKKMNQITSKIVPPEKREKIKKSLSPNQPKSPSSKASSFRVPPMVFNIKKVRDGEVSTQELTSPEAEAHVEIPALGGLDREVPMAEVHTQDGLVEEIQEILSPSTPDTDKAEIAINGEAPTIECEMNGDRSAGLAVPENDEIVGDEEEEVEETEEGKEKLKSPVETTADTQTPMATIAVEQVS